MKLLDSLSPSTIGLTLEGADAETVLAQLVGLLEAQGIVKDEEALLQALLEREALGSTGIGHGVAIPHARSAEVNRPAVAFGRSATPVDFAAIDGAPTQLFFLLVAPEQGSAEHLHLLARIAKLVRDPTAREGLMQAPDADTVLQVIAGYAV